MELSFLIYTMTITTLAVLIIRFTITRFKSKSNFIDLKIKILGFGDGQNMDEAKVKKIRHALQSFKNEEINVSDLLKTGISHMKLKKKENPKRDFAFHQFWRKTYLFLKNNLFSRYFFLSLSSCLLLLLVCLNLQHFSNLQNIAVKNDNLMVASKSNSSTILNELSSANPSSIPTKNKNITKSIKRNDTSFDLAAIIAESSTVTKINQNKSTLLPEIPNAVYVYDDIIEKNNRSINDYTWSLFSPKNPIVHSELKRKVEKSDSIYYSQKYKAISLDKVKASYLSDSTTNISFIYVSDSIDFSKVNKEYLPYFWDSFIKINGWVNNTVNWFNIKSSKRDISDITKVNLYKLYCTFYQSPSSSKSWLMLNLGSQNTNNDSGEIHLKIDIVDLKSNLVLNSLFLPLPKKINYLSDNASGFSSNNGLYLNQNFLAEITGNTESNKPYIFNKTTNENYSLSEEKSWDGMQAYLEFKIYDWLTSVTHTR